MGKLSTERIHLTLRIGRGLAAESGPLI
jgi:hypothetical protein